MHSSYWRTGALYEITAPFVRTSFASESLHHSSSFCGAGQLYGSPAYGHSISHAPFLQTCSGGHFTMFRRPGSGDPNSSYLHMPKTRLPSARQLVSKIWPLGSSTAIMSNASPFWTSRTLQFNFGILV